jgi:hypothetical protein
MKNKLAEWEFSSFIFVIGLGTFLHFFFEMTGKNHIAGLFSAVNESTWEHLKLLFFPYMIFAVAEYYAVGKNYKGFFKVKASGIILGMLSVIILFYTYSGIIGHNFTFIDILIFIISAGISSFYSYKYIGKSEGDNFAGLVILAVIAVMFALFTFYPPHIGLFLDPVSLKYGII